jgi:hypothetical protein
MKRDGLGWRFRLGEIAWGLGRRVELGEVARRLGWRAGFGRVVGRLEIGFLLGWLQAFLGQWLRSLTRRFTELLFPCVRLGYPTPARCALARYILTVLVYDPIHQGQVFNDASMLW